MESAPVSLAEAPSSARSTSALPPESRACPRASRGAAPVAFMEAELDRAREDEAELERIYLEGAEHELAFWDALWAGPSRAEAPR